MTTLNTGLSSFSLISQDKFNQLKELPGKLGISDKAHIGIKQDGSLVAYRGRSYLLHPQQSQRAAQFLRTLQDQSPSARLDHLTAALQNKLSQGSPQWSSVVQELKNREDGTSTRTRFASSNLPQLIVDNVRKKPAPPSNPMNSAVLQHSVSAHEDDEETRTHPIRPTTPPTTPIAAAKQDLNNKMEQLVSRSRQAFSRLPGFRQTHPQPKERTMSKSTTVPDLRVAEARGLLIESLKNDDEVAKNIATHINSFSAQLAVAKTEDKEGLTRLSSAENERSKLYQTLAQQNASNPLTLHQTMDVIRAVIYSAQIKPENIKAQTADDIYKKQLEHIHDMNFSEQATNTIVGAFKALAKTHEQASDDMQDPFNKVSVGNVVPAIMFDLSLNDAVELQQENRKKLYHDPATRAGTIQEKIAHVLQLWDKH